MPGSHLTWLSSRERFGVKLGLDSVRALLAELGDPHIDLPAVLVAGTNGKGSTAAMIAAVLTAAGRRTLLYTSPHVAHVSERIRVDGKAIRTDALERRLGQVRAAVRRLARGGSSERGGHGRASAGDTAFKPTYFEVLTAAALLQARAAKVTAAVFEIGLGGRYDATNVIPAPVAVITGIDRDHTEYLGKSLKKIAWNKAGIIKKDQNVFTLESRAELLGVFRQEARRRGATLVQVPGRCARRRQTGVSAHRGPLAGSRKRIDDDGGGRQALADIWDLDLRSARLAGGRRLPERLTGVSLGLHGPRQGPQAVLALAAAGSLLEATGENRSLPAGALRSALAGVHLPGRFEQRRLSQGRLLVADVAHNPAAAVLLAEEIRNLAAGHPVTLLFGALADKDAWAMLTPLLGVVDSVNLVRISHHRSLRTKDLADLARKISERSGPRAKAGSAGTSPPRLASTAPVAGKPIHLFSDTAAAWRATLAATPPAGIVLVAGSFYLLGNLWPRIRRYPRART
jgi:dihydrofolate synthase/folylpolyglutamate synthase